MASKRARSKNTLGTRLTEMSAKIDEQAAKSRGKSTEDLESRVAELESRLTLLSSSNYRVSQDGPTIAEMFPGLTGTQVSNWNDAIVAGFYWAPGAALNNPVGNISVGVVIPYGPDGTYDRIMQEVWFPSTGVSNQMKTWRRVASRSTSGVWTFEQWQQVVPSWDEVTGKPSTFPASADSVRTLLTKHVSDASNGRAYFGTSDTGTGTTTDSYLGMGTEPDSITHAFWFNYAGKELLRIKKDGQLDNEFIPWAMAAGVANVTASFPVVTLPSGRFTQPPIITAQLYSGAGGDIGVGTMVTNVTTTQFQCRHTATSGTKPVHWHAVQMKSGSANG